MTQKIPLNSEFCAFFILSDPYNFAIHPVILFQNAFCTKLSVPRQFTLIVLASLLKISDLVVIHVLFGTKYQTQHMQTVVLKNPDSIENQVET